MAPELTHDSFLNGNLKVRQSKSGYRFSIDANLLANHTKLKTGDRVADIGTGCGIISLILAYRHPESEIVGIEIQKELADIAKKNGPVNIGRTGAGSTSQGYSYDQVMTTVEFKGSCPCSRARRRRRRF